MLDIFPKISSIPIKISPWGLLTCSFPREVASVGFAFAGSTLFANAVKEVFSYLLGSLKSLDKGEELRNKEESPMDEIASWTALHPFNDSIRETLPSMEDLSALAVDVTRQVLISNAVHQGGTRGTCSFLIFGHCFQQQKYRCFSIEHIAGREEFQSKEVPLSIDPFNFAIIGDRHADIACMVAKQHAESEGIQKSRRPLYVLQNLIKSSTYLSIGGHIQLALGSQFGVAVKGTLNPADGGFQYFGYSLHQRGQDNITNLRTVGRFLIDPPTMCT